MGILVGDIIIKVIGERVAPAATGSRPEARAVTPAARLQELVSLVGEGEPVELEVRRGDEVKKLTVIPRRMAGPLVTRWHWFEKEQESGSEQEWRLVLENVRRWSARWRDLGMTSLSPELGEFFGASEGVLVTRSSGGHSLPLRPGDVILKVDGSPVTSPFSVVRALTGRSGGTTVHLEVLRKGKVISLAVEARRTPPSARPTDACRSCGGDVSPKALSGDASPRPRARALRRCLEKPLRSYHDSPPRGAR